MLWHSLGPLAVSLMASIGMGQAVPDLSKDPRLQQTVEVHVMRVPIPTLLATLHKQTNMKFLNAKELEPIRLCAFVHDRPLWLVMQSLADVFGCRWKDLGSEWRLALQPETAPKLAAYRRAENEVLCRQVDLRAKALADIVSKQGWSGAVADAPSIGSESDKEETPDRWAARVAQDPAYFTAGIMFANTSIYSDTGWKFDCRGNFVDCPTPVAYRLIAPPTSAIANAKQCSDPGSQGTSLAGLQISVRSLKWAGTLEAALVNDSSHRVTRPRRLIRYPKPTADLAKTPSGKWLLDWETALKDCPDEALDSKLSTVVPAASNWFKAAQGIEEYLEAFSDSTGIPVICDGFRMPIVGRDIPNPGATARTWLISLQESQGCFVRIQNGAAMVRHGGFWDLAEWEPSEEAIERLESIPNPGLDDYADCAFALLDSKHDADTFDLPFFETQQIPLTTFDSTPLCDRLLTLAAFGQMAEVQRVHILSGGSVDWYRSNRDDRKIVFDTRPWSFRGKKYTIYTPRQVGGYEGTDRFINAACRYGPFFSGRCIGFESRLLESYAFPAQYRHLWSDSPDDYADFVDQYEAVTIFHAHYLSLLSGASTLPQSPRSERHATGKFTFFLSISNADGLLSDVTIPAQPSVGR